MWRPKEEELSVWSRNRKHFLIRLGGWNYLYEQKLGDIKHIIAEEIINVTTNRTITVKNNDVVKNKKDKMFCFAPASVESIPDRWN